jgi:hypothetical protein
MLHKLSDLTGFSLRATDERLGHIRDVFVDSKTWAIRYLVIDTGGWLSGKTLLVAPDHIQRVDREEKAIYLDASCAEIERGIQHDPKDQTTAYMDWKSGAKRDLDEVEEASFESFPASDPPGHW